MTIEMLCKMMDSGLPTFIGPVAGGCGVYGIVCGLTRESGFEGKLQGVNVKVWRTVARDYVEVYVRLS